MSAVMLVFAGAFTTVTYLRPFLETRIGVDVSQLSLLLLGLGVAGFVGTYGVSLLLGKHLYGLLAGLPFALGVTTLALLAAGHDVWPAAGILFVWGVFNSAMPVAWSTWLTQGIADDPESGGGLMVAAIQLAIMLGGALGGVLLDHLSLAATWVGGASLLILASFVAMRGARLRPASS